MLRDSPRVALLDVVVLGPEGEGGPEAALVEGVLKELGRFRCFEPSGRKMRQLNQ